MNVIQYIDATIEQERHDLAEISPDESANSEIINPYFIGHDWLYGTEIDEAISAIIEH